MKKIMVGLIILLVVGIFFYTQKQVEDTQNDSQKIQGATVAVLEEDVQVVNLKVDGINYVPSELTVQKGKPVKLIVDGTEAEGCVQYFTIPKFEINIKLGAGENIFEFTPTEVEEIPFSCSMNMAIGTIRVVDEEVVQPIEIDLQLETEKELSYEPFLPGEKLNFDSLSKAESTSIIDVSDGEEITITADIVWKEINGHKIKMYAYNRMIPGVVLRVEQESTITVNFVNNIDWNTTIHWHGLRHDIKDDGVPGVSQDPVPPGSSHKYSLYFPDEGIYWYHPHVREDIQQEMGLAGNMLVNPENTNYYNSVDREELLVLDDILMDDEGVVPFGKVYGSHSIMGRFGNVMLINGESDYSLNIKRGEVIRFYMTNVANVRPFNLSFTGEKMKLIGSDLGKYEQEEFVNSVIIAPAERYIVEVFFAKEGTYKIENRNSHGVTKLGEVNVNGVTETENFKSFPKLHDNKEIITDIENYREFFDKEVDYQIDLTIDMPEMDASMMPEKEEHQKIEWEDTMKVMNEMFTSENVKWILEDHDSKKRNKDIGMKAKVGDLVKIRLFNDGESMHPMQHPIHLHGQRFLITNIDGERPSNLVWKDTVLVPIGSTVDILVDVTNPGEWMMHCHIAEHLEAGMMTGFMVGK